MTMLFDTLKLTDDFKAVGSDEPKARALAEKFRHLADDHLVTKEYLDCKLQEQSYTLTLRVGGLIVAVLTFFRVMEHFWR